MNNDTKIRSRIQDRIAERAAAIKALIEKVRAITGESGEVEVGGRRLSSSVRAAGEGRKGTNYVSCAIPYHDGDGYQVTVLIMPGSAHENPEWIYECVADKLWDGMSTDYATLQKLKLAFDSEQEEMDFISETVEMFLKEHDDVISFFS